MALVRARTHIEEPAERVFQVLTDWEGQAAWMTDARDVRVVGARRAGSGVRLRVPTDIAFSFVVVDELVVTDWVAPKRVAVRHEGRWIRGHGAFELERNDPHGTVFTWWEEVDVPFGQLGELLARLLVVPYTTWVFRTSLANLKRVCESRAVRPRSGAPAALA